MIDGNFNSLFHRRRDGKVVRASGLVKPKSKAFANQSIHAAKSVAAVLCQNAADLSQGCCFNRAEGYEGFALPVREPRDLHDRHYLQQGFFDLLARMALHACKSGFQRGDWVEAMAYLHVDESGNIGPGRIKMGEVFFGQALEKSV